METNTFDQEMLIIIGGLFTVILVLLGIVIFLGFWLYKQKDTSAPEQIDGENASDSQKSIAPPELTCQNHEKENAKGLCAICGESFCEKCLFSDDVLSFCRDHFQIYLQSKWKEIETVMTTPDDSHASMYIHDFKQAIWKTESIPTYIMTHYKINVENDLIESHIKLYVKEENGDDLLARLSNFKQKS